MIQGLAILAATLSLASCGQPPPPASPQAAPLTPQLPATTPPAKPPVPAFKPGMVVTDRTGAKVGVVQTVTETPGGLNVVIEIEGKLVGVLPATLQIRGEGAVSSQTREEILATAGAPR